MILRVLEKLTRRCNDQSLDYVKMAMLVQGLYQVVMDSVNIPNTPIVAQKNPANHGALGLH